MGDSKRDFNSIWVGLRQMSFSHLFVIKVRVTFDC